MSKQMLKEIPSAPSSHISSARSGGSGRRRNFSEADKKRIVEETCREGASVSGVARKYGIATRLLFSWKKELTPETSPGPTFLPVTGQYEEAIAGFNKSITLSPNFVLGHRFLAIVYSDLGRMEEARAAAAAESLRLTPRVSLEIWGPRAPYKPQAVLDRLATALGNVGIPEHAPPPVPDKP